MVVFLLGLSEEKCEEKSPLESQRDNIWATIPMTMLERVFENIKE